MRRARVKTGTGKRRVYSGKYALSHLIYCSDCGDLYRRTQWYLKGEHVPVWRCVSRLEKRKSGIDCPSRTLYETDLHAAVITAFNQMIEQKDEFLPGMRLAMDRALAQNNSPRVAEIDARSEELQKELLKKANAKQGFEELADEIDALREEKQALLLEDANRTAMKQRSRTTSNLNSNVALRPRYRCKQSHRAGAPSGALFLHLGDGNLT